MNALNLFELEAAAREILPPVVWDYIAGGAEDESTVRENRDAFGRLKLRPRVLVDAGAPNLRTEVLGQPIALPVLLGPTSHQRMVHPEAELATARAAAAMGTIAVFGTGTHYSIEQIAAVTDGSLWFQLYCVDSRAVTTRLIERAAAAGCTGLVLTVDGSYRTRRERDIRNRFRLPPEVELGTLVGVGLQDHLLQPGGAGMDAFIATLSPLPMTWADIAWLRSVTRLPIILKGIMTGEDAGMAVEHGVDAVIVSNHGGRQLDGALASVDALPEVVERVAGRLAVLVDGGIRRGTDVLKALAVGAKAVLIGRPYLWGLATGGEAGVRQVLELLHDEIGCALAQLGRPNITAIDHGMVTGADRGR
jgi:4-hydroxymandelate oxidase